MVRIAGLIMMAVSYGALVAGCAGPTSDLSGTSSDAASSSVAQLGGTWQGYFGHPGADYTSPSQSDVTLEVREDSTYVLKMGARPKSTGTLVAKGNRVVLDDSSGSSVTLVHSGNALYGILKDPMSGRGASISLEKREAAVGQSAGPAARETIPRKLCEAAGGEYTEGACHAATDSSLATRCVARGGTYF